MASSTVSATTSVTYTVRRWSTPFPATAFGHSSTMLHGRERKSSRYLYISKFIHKSTPTRRHSSDNTSRFFSNPNKDNIDNTSIANTGEEENDHDDDECNLQILVQQVQKEDSEWYYHTFSKLLDAVVDDPMELSLCEKSRTNDLDGKEFDADNDNVDLEKEMIDDKNDDNYTKINEVLENVPENKNIDSKTIDIEMPPQFNGSETENSVVMIQSNMQEDEIRKGPILRGEEEEVEEVREEPSFRDRMNEDRISSKNRVQEVERDNKEPFNTFNNELQIGKRERSIVIENGEKYERGNENDHREDTQPTRMNLPVNKSPESNADNQQAESSRMSPPLFVRLRNIYTGEVVELCSLSTLLNAGFSKKEILVLRPKVLELIIEDGIQRPKKGLPKRWVRLSKLEGYEGKLEEEEDDEDFDWEVEINVSKSLGKMIGQDAPKEKDSGDGMHEAAEKSPQPNQDRKPRLKTKDADKGNGVYASKSIIRGNQNTSKQPKQSSRSKNKGQVSESWGPFTSTRLPNSDDDDDGGGGGDVSNDSTVREKPKRRVARDEEDSSRRYDDNVQLPPQKKTRPTIDRPNYDEEDDDIDERRPPQPQRRKSVDDFNSRSKTPSQQSIANQQQRRRRQRPIDQRRELIIDRGDDDEPPPNKFWMDLPTFRDYLRTEAQLRLKILGPDWKESVLDESRWRYDLYKTWLTMLGEGVGENPLYEYGGRPRRTEDRKRSPPPPPRSRGERETGRSQRQIRRQKRIFDEEGYEDDYSDENRPRRRPKMPQEEQKYRYGEERNQADRRPRPQSVRGSTWRNFSDLEESLQSSSQERPRSVRQSFRGEGDEEEGDSYFDEAEEGLSSRSRSSRASKTGARREYVEPRSELSFEDDRTTWRRKGASDFDETVS